MAEPVVKKQATRNSISDRRRRLRQQLWPEVDEGSLWLRSQRQGFTTIPRSMNLIGRIMDQHSGKGFPVLQTYLTLWCWVFDEGLVEIRNPREFAYEAGFSGARGEATWRGRMRRLQDLGFIDAKAGLAGDFQFVLILNPYLAIAKLYSKQPPDVAYTALLSRMAQVGATDLDLAPEEPAGVAGREPDSDSATAEGEVKAATRFLRRARKRL